MKLSPELYQAVQVRAEPPAATFQICAHPLFKATVAVDKLGAFVAVYEGCGDERHRFDGPEMAPLVRDLIQRALADDPQARDLLHEIASEGISAIRTERADPLMLDPVTATLSRSIADGSAVFGARIDIADGPGVEGLPSTDACIAAMHRMAGSSGFIVTRVLVGTDAAK